MFVFHPPENIKQPKLEKGRKKGQEEPLRQNRLKLMYVCFTFTNIYFSFF